MTKIVDEDFTPLNVVKKNLTDFNRSAYRVYKSQHEFVTVEAATALEAMKESGVQAPLRIVREIRFMERMVSQNRFTEHEELVQTGKGGSPKHNTALAAAVAAAQAEAQIPQRASHTIIQPEETLAVAPAAPESADGDLSPEDVAALLGTQPNA